MILKNTTTLLTAIAVFNNVIIIYLNYQGKAELLVSNR